MQLEDIDKATYKKRLNMITILLIVALACISIGVSSILIAQFGSETVAGESTGNFHLNLIGVLIAVVVCAFTAFKLKETPYFKEVYYVWRLKIVQNKIYRKLKAIKKRASENDRDAIVVLNFYYRSLEQVYTLDNNTLTLPELKKNIINLEEQIDALAITVTIEDFDISLLD